MLGLEYHPNALGLELPLEPVGDLGAKPLLDLEIAAEELDNTAELAEPDDPLARQIADVRHPWNGSRWCMQSEWNGIDRATISSS